MNTSTFQSNEKYLNSKINGNIEGRQSRKERILLSYSRKKDHLDHSLMTIRRKLWE